MERMKRIENLNVRGIRTQGIVRDDGTTRTCIAWFPPAASVPTELDGCVAGSSTSFP